MSPRKTAPRAREASTRARDKDARVHLHPHGLELRGGEVVPLVCGAMHYWRNDPNEWGAALDAMRAMGMRLVDTYVPWGVHEMEPRLFDFGERSAALDLARFLRLCHERGLYVVIRPGPHINAELTNFGLPERIVWDRACQARTPRDNPVMLPMVPAAFPVPSYASEAFHEEVETWFDACGPILAEHLYPEGPIVMLQIDNEGALYFRDGPYDQDYHPDSIQLFRSFLRTKYKRPSALRSAWGDGEVSFGNAEPPARFDAEGPDDLARHLDWVEYHEHLLATAFERMGQKLAELGVSGVPTMHNFPLGEAATPLNAQRLAGSIDLVALDYYHQASPAEHVVLMRRTTELAGRAEGAESPAYAAEIGAGFPPFFAPQDEKDSLYTLQAALGYGLRGFNLYMAVERDRWIGAPIDPHGRPRKLADAYKELCATLERTRFFALERRAPVRLVIPRSLRRLARASHAFGPLTPALFNVLGAGFRESCFEEDFGHEPPEVEVADTADARLAPTLAAEAYIRAFERALSARGVPFAYAGGESLTASTRGAAWIVCATPGGLKADVLTQLRARAGEGCRVTIGPVVPSRDGAWRRMNKPHDVTGLELWPLDDAARADALVARRIDELGLPTYPVDPAEAHVSVHHDAGGAPRLVFVMNPTPAPLVAKVAVAGARALADAMGNARQPIARTAGAFEVRVPGRTVRILEVTEV